MIENPNFQPDYKIAPYNFKGLKTALGQTPMGAFLLQKDCKLPRVGVVGVGGSVTLKNGTGVTVTHEVGFNPGDKVFLYEQGVIPK